MTALGTQTLNLPRQHKRRPQLPSQAPNFRLLEHKLKLLINVLDGPLHLLKSIRYLMQRLDDSPATLELFRMHLPQGLQQHRVIRDPYQLQKILRLNLLPMSIILSRQACLYRR